MKKIVACFGVASVVAGCSLHQPEGSLFQVDEKLSSISVVMAFPLRDPSLRPYVVAPSSAVDNGITVTQLQNGGIDLVCPEQTVARLDRVPVTQDIRLYCSRRKGDRDFVASSAFYGCGHGMAPVAMSDYLTPQHPDPTGYAIQCVPYIPHIPR